MSLLEAAATTPKKRAGGTCAMQRILRAMDDGERAVLVGWMSEPATDRPSSWIADVLVKEGYDAKRDTITRHRSHGCMCP